MSPLLQIRGLQKSYSVPVLEDFDFELLRGEVHALIGSNGAGKSTLAGILAGLTPRNAGEILLDQQPYRPASKEDATAAGVVLVLQELNIIPTLTVAENLFLHALPHRGGFIAAHALRQQSLAALERVGLTDVDPDSPAGRLGVGQQQLVEIAGALAQDSSILILDEPTAALTGPEIQLLFDNIDALRAEGVAMIYISHRMDEIARIADRVTVMRDGRRIATHHAREVDDEQLIREMAGGDISRRKESSLPPAASDIGLQVRHLVSGDSVRGVSFDAHRGEILGIAGLIGAGRTETLRAIFGADAITSGELLLGAKAEPFRPRSPADAVQARIALIPEDRKLDGLLLSKSIAVNATLATTDRQARHGILSHGAEMDVTESVCDRLAVKRDSPEQTTGTLSGGNQQKVVIARWLLRDADVFLFDEPTRGIDVAAKAAIYELLDELAAAGKVLVLVSSDLTELMAISHRIVVMSNGMITGEFKPDDWSQEQITAAAFAGFSTVA